ncbi:MAG: glycosyltransferase family 4 protein, partial [Pseudomonadota bacterium]
MKPVIIHISADYPDPINSNKTRAVFNLVGGTTEFDHIVYSINRVNGLSGMRFERFDDVHTAIEYKALPKGILWGRRLKALADWILEDIRARDLKPNIIEAHKFTVEGVIGMKLSDALDCAFVCDIMGGTDCKLLKQKPDFIRKYRQIAQQADLFFPYAPWSIDPFEKAVGLDREKCSLLPVVTDLDVLTPAPEISEPKLVTVFHFESWKRKNIKNLIAAIKSLRTDHPNITLDIVGAGTEAQTQIIQNMIDNAGLGASVSLLGRANNGTLPDIFKNYAAFVLPTLNDTYGQVYAEALFCGLPVLFSKDTSIDGYFESSDVGYACNPKSVEDIAAGIDHILTHEAALKDDIARMQE